MRGFESEELFGERKICENLSAIQIMVKVAVEEKVPEYSYLPEEVQPICAMCLQEEGKRVSSSTLLHHVLSLSV